MLITLVITKLPTEIPDSITIGDEVLSRGHVSYEIFREILEVILEEAGSDLKIGDEILLDPDAMKWGIKRDGKILPI